jgi:hypothetical protein
MPRSDSENSFIFSLMSACWQHTGIDPSMMWWYRLSKTFNISSSWMLILYWIENLLLLVFFLAVCIVFFFPLGSRPCTFCSFYYYNGDTTTVSAKKRWNVLDSDTVALWLNDRLSLWKGEPKDELQFFSGVTGYTSQHIYIYSHTNASCGVTTHYDSMVQKLPLTEKLKLPSHSLFFSMTTTSCFILLFFVIACRLK